MVFTESRRGGSPPSVVCWVTWRRTLEVRRRFRCSRAAVSIESGEDIDLLYFRQSITYRARRPRPSARGGLRRRVPSLARVLRCGLTRVQRVSAGSIHLAPSPSLDMHLDGIASGRADEVRAPLSDDLQPTLGPRASRGLTDHHQRCLSRQAQGLRCGLDAMTPVELVWGQVGLRTLALVDAPSGSQAVREVRRPYRDGPGAESCDDGVRRWGAGHG